MRITLYMAISIDGLIATTTGDSGWVSPADVPLFESTIKAKGCLIVGRKTFEQYEGELYPFPNVLNIVLSNQKEPKKFDDQVVFVQTAEMAISEMKKRNYEEAVLIGGGHTNGTFLKKKLIDEIFLSVHPLILGNGVKLFEEIEQPVPLQLLGYIEMNDGLIQLHYKITK